MLLANARLATMTGTKPHGMIEKGALLIKGETIAWAGPLRDLPAGCNNEKRLDLQGRLVTPGLIDCHTHIVHAGERAQEFEMRLAGADYREIARAGGGIASSVRATRAADEATLIEQALPRVDALLGEGVTTLEIKSGYGLDRVTELRMLRTARHIAMLRRVDIQTSFLGAHAVPPEYTGRAAAYIEEIVIPVMKEAAKSGLIDAVDGYCETIAFDTAAIAQLFTQAKTLGLHVKLHADQLSNNGGTRLVASFGGLSADHVEYADAADAQALAAAGTVAVLLPGAFYTLRETRLPPIESLRAHGVLMAIATDCNPGTSPLTSLLLAMNMGAVLFGLTSEEVLAGVTCHAARALGLADRGVIAPDKQADLALWDVEKPVELFYRPGLSPLYARIHKGELCTSS